MDKINSMPNKAYDMDSSGSGYTKKQIKRKFRFLKSILPKSRKEKYLEMAKIIYEYNRDVYETKSAEHRNTLEYDEEASKKFFSFVVNLTRLKEKLNISIGNKNITINCNDYSKKSYSGNKINEDRIEIGINLDGFSIRKDYSNEVTYRDDKMFDKVLPIIKEKNKEINKSILFETIDSFIVDSGLSREINLEELTKNKEI